MTAPLRHPNPSRLRWRAALLCVFAAAAWAGGARADWLVTTEGERVETRGPWRLEGSRVVFEAPNGALTAVRASTIDFAATEAYAAELAAPPAPEERPVPAEPVLVLTDRDLPRVMHVPEPAATATSGADGATGEAAAAGAAPAGAPDRAAAGDAGETERTGSGDLAGVVVTSWQERESDTGLRFIGTLANESKSFATSLRVEAALFDEAGRLVDTRSARLARTSISPGRSTTFEVDFPGLFAYREVRFTPAGRALASRGASTTDAAAGDPQAETEEPPQP